MSRIVIRRADQDEYYLDNLLFLEDINANFAEVYSLLSPTVEIANVWGYISVPADTTITTAGTYYPILGTFVNDSTLFSAAVVNTPGIKYDGTITRKFEIDLHSQVTASVLNTVVTLGVFKNGVLIPGSDISNMIRNTGEPYAASLTVVVSLAQDDEIQLMVTTDDDGDVLNFQNLQTTIRPF